MEPSELLAPTVDKSQVPPLHQKRIVAFINHFLISSCGFLNQFAENCESKFIDLERKMQKLEASIAIIEAKLDSIPENTVANNKMEIQTNQEKATEIPAKTESPPETEAPTPSTPAEPLVRACEDLRYKKFFKMVQFGVPPNAVKMKMQAEGVDPSLLDTPNLELIDGTKAEM